MQSLLVIAVCLLALAGRSAALGGFSSQRNRHSYLKYGAVPPPSRSMVLEKNFGKSEMDLNSLFPDDDSSAESCNNKPCTANEQCCQGAVCIDVEASLVGSCYRVYGSKQGEACERTVDCETGLVCMDNHENDVIFRTCQRDTSTYHKKPYNEECSTSNECQVEKGLCCQVQRRHRQAPRKICAYFKDERVCIGQVDGAALGIASTVGFKKSVSKALLG